MPGPTSARRSIVRRPLRWAVLMTSLFLVAGCSTAAPEKQELSDALVDSGLSRKVADCTASALTTSLSSEELAQIAERGAGGAPVDDPKVQGDDADVLAKAMTVCRDLQIASQPTTTTTTVEVPSTGLPLTDGAELNPASTTTTAP